MRPHSRQETDHGGNQSHRYARVTEHSAQRRNRSAHAAGLFQDGAEKENELQEPARALQVLDVDNSFSDPLQDSCEGQSKINPKATALEISVMLKGILSRNSMMMAPMIKAIFIKSNMG